MGVNLGKSDDEVLSAIQDMQVDLFAMIEATSSTHPRTHEVAGLAQDDRNVALSLDPKKIEEEYELVRKVAFEIGEDAEILVNLRQAHHKLNGWKGTAADEFRKQLTRIERFMAETQHGTVLYGLQCLGALFSLAYHMRQSYHDLAVAVSSYANHEIDQQRTREDQLKLAIGKEFVTAAFSINSGQLASSAVNFAVEAIGALGDHAIEGTGADAVIDGYRQRSISLRETFESNLNQLTDKLMTEWSEKVRTTGELDVMEPLPSSVDVSSPDFSYEAFSTEEYPPGGPFAQQVETERERYAQEEAERDSEINRRLGEQG